MLLKNYLPLIRLDKNIFNSRAVQEPLTIVKVRSVSFNCVLFIYTIVRNEHMLLFLQIKKFHVELKLYTCMHDIV